MTPGRVRVGCSGWQYREWAGRFYPSGLARARWFEHYASVFDTVELNSTFYRLPELATVERWAARAPVGFVYAVKLGAFGSHRMKLRDPAGWLANHVERVRRFGPSQGPTVVQLPPRWRCDAGRLDAFLAAAPSDLRWAVEIRDPSWLCDPVFEVLAAHRAALCWHDLLEVPQLVTAPFLYVRRHGPHAARAPYRGRYGRVGLATTIEALVRERDQGLDAYVYFNNDVGGAAPADARLLQRELAR